MSRLPAFIVSLAVFLPAMAFAQSGPLQGACRNDVKALCATVTPGGGRIRECMKEHRAQLSEACKSAILTRMLEHHKAGPPGELAQTKSQSQK
jgi:Cysteine rich repeat